MEYSREGTQTYAPNLPKCNKAVSPILENIRSPTNQVYLSVGGSSCRRRKFLTAGSYKRVLIYSCRA